MVKLSTSRKIALATAAHRCLRLLRGWFGMPMKGVFRRSGLAWDLDLAEGIDFSIFLLGSFEPSLVRFYRRAIPAGSTVLDLGANVGAHTLPLARAVGSRGRVVAVEPTAYAMAKLRRNLALNPELAPRVVARQVFLVEREDAHAAKAVASSWKVDGSPADDPTLGGTLMSTEGAGATTLDALMQDLSLPRVDWIKLDVDGHELEVLLGGRHTLERHRPRILMELAPYCYSASPGGFDRLVGLLHELGYGFHRPGAESPLPQDRRKLLACIPHLGSINVLAAPRSPGALGR